MRGCSHENGSHANLIDLMKVVTVVMVLVP